jgi:hypothetical protein
MYDVRIDEPGERQGPEFAVALHHEPRPTDPWLFTDRFARSVYARQGRLGRLKEDIRAYVMRHRRWAPEELEFSRELVRLLQAEALTRKGTFGYLSPHPTVYRAECEGELIVSGRRFHFDGGDDIVFEPWLARLSAPGLFGPLRVGRLRSLTTLSLSCEAFPRVSLLCERGLAILQQTVPNGATGQMSRYP